MNLNITSRGFGCALTLFVCGSAADSAAASRDWAAYPAIVQLDTSEDIFAVGDPHGDPKRLAGVLAAAKLIDGAPISPNQVKWAGGRSVLVVTGDLIDKGTNSIAVIMLLRALHESTIGFSAMRETQAIERCSNSVQRSKPVSPKMDSQLKN